MVTVRTPPKAPPSVRGWRLLGPMQMLPAYGYGMSWQRRSLRVQSSVEIIDGRPLFHVSVRLFSGPVHRFSRSPSDLEIDFVREAFGMEAAEERNPGHGATRNLWLPVGPEVTS